jgi:hypothetical protein
MGMSERVINKPFGLDTRGKVTCEGDFILYLTDGKLTVRKVKDVRIKDGNWEVLAGKWIKENYYKLAGEE